MTIKELNEFMSDHGFCNTNNEEDLPKKYVCDLVESALKEGRAKAISEFAEQIKARAHSTERNDWSADYMISIWESVIDEIAMELKGEQP